MDETPTFSPVKGDLVNPMNQEGGSNKKEGSLEKVMGDFWLNGSGILDVAAKDVKDFVDAQLLVVNNKITEMSAEIAGNHSVLS